VANKLPLIYEDKQSNASIKQRVVFGSIEAIVAGMSDNSHAKYDYIVFLEINYQVSLLCCMLSRNCICRSHSSLSQHCMSSRPQLQATALAAGARYVWSWGLLEIANSLLPPVTKNRSGYDVSGMFSHRDPSWHPFFSHLWLSNRRPQNVCIRRQSSSHACWWRLICMYVLKGVLSKDMATTGEYLKTISAVFHLNNKNAKRKLKSALTTKRCPFAPNQIPLSNPVQTLTYRWHLESLRKKSCVALLRRLAG